MTDILTQRPSIAASPSSSSQTHFYSSSALLDRRRRDQLQVSFSTPSNPHFGAGANDIRGSRDDQQQQQQQQQKQRQQSHSNSNTGGSKNSNGISQPLRSGSSSGSVNSENKPKLPPIAAMASPQAGDYGWAFNSSAGSSNLDMHNSLRAGPLSPAMLAGPAGYGKTGLTPGGDNGRMSAGLLNGFDPSSMRTGLTPDVGRTGLTPYITGSTGHGNGSFPPPSPNTAALIAMVTHQQGGGGSSAGGTSHLQPGGSLGAFTPNTLNAITNAMMSVEHGTDGHGGGQGNAHPLSMSHVPNGGHHDDDPAHTAANGLFLLSQAHHELTKREQTDQNDSSNNNNHKSNDNNMHETDSNVSSHGGNGGGGNTSSKKKSNGRKATKRKASAAAATNSDAAPTTKRSKNAKATPTKKRAPPKKPETSESEDDGMMMMDDDDDDDDQVGSDEDELGMSGQGSGGKSKKFETEEDKRKNFLERNRQAALKCRQRKKAWLNQLQAKVEYLTAENERLSNTTVSMREEISRLSAVVVAHRDCGLGGVSVERSEQLIASTQGVKGVVGGPLATVGGSPHISVLGNPAGKHASNGASQDQTEGSPALSGTTSSGGTVSSNVPAQNIRRSASSNVDGSPVPPMTTTRTRSARNSNASDTTIAAPQMVTAGRGGKRYGY